MPRPPPGLGTMASQEPSSQCNGPPSRPRRPSRKHLWPLSPDHPPTNHFPFPSSPKSGAWELDGPLSGTLDGPQGRCASFLGGACAEHSLRPPGPFGAQSRFTYVTPTPLFCSVRGLLRSWAGYRRTARNFQWAHCSGSPFGGRDRCLSGTTALRRLRRQGSWPSRGGGRAAPALQLIRFLHPACRHRRAHFKFGSIELCPSLSLNGALAIECVSPKWAHHVPPQLDLVLAERAQKSMPL